MTNAEKYKNVSERRFAYEEDCRKNGEIIGEFAWLDLEYKEELNPCPFCGGEVILYDLAPYVRCKSCGVQVGYMTQEEAIATWNRRAK